ncbi:hypothetical protein [Actinomadura montaniterrae]|uniref:hypothetical protein n=1 Tax=Actinomadura montaniterrae TaxID=1803903 RepID=UPI001CEFA8EC|nr:hypothetical protein [Actinomadura montaniterrae]
MTVATRLRVARVTVAAPDGGGELGYNTLLYALGGHGARDRGVPGAASRPARRSPNTGRACR